jgi:hypothetical protein
MFPTLTPTGDLYGISVVPNSPATLGAPGTPGMMYDAFDNDDQWVLPGIEVVF